MWNILTRIAFLQKNSWWCSPCIESKGNGNNLRVELCWNRKIKRVQKEKDLARLSRLFSKWHNRDRRKENPEMSTIGWVSRQTCPNIFIYQNPRKSTIAKITKRKIMKMSEYVSCQLQSSLQTPEPYEETVRKLIQYLLVPIWLFSYILIIVAYILKREFSQKENKKTL